MTTRTETQIDLVKAAAEDQDHRGSRYSGMSYEQGVYDALTWVTGEDEELDEQFPFDEANDG